MRIRQAASRLARRFLFPGPRPLVLMYHRVTDVKMDPWGLAVTPRRFAEHLAVVRRTRFPLRLVELARRLRSGTLPRNAVCLTFDDGYVDNLLAAKPRLAAADVPATLFLPTGYVGRAAEFWWDELARLLLVEDGPRQLAIDVPGEQTSSRPRRRRLAFELGRAAENPAAPGWKAWSEPPATARQAAYIAIWRALRPLPEHERETLLADIRSKFCSGRTHADTLDRPMTRPEVIELLKGGLLDIGAHGVTHPALTALPSAARDRELTESKAACEELLGAPVSAFAYPYGDFDRNVRAAVRSAGFECACSTMPGSISRFSDLLALPRVHVLNWDGAEFEKALHMARSE
jgi:peptidoglycan/xylan/chitin deacetylase (PgdA/CDA1 family)